MLRLDVVNLVCTVLNLLILYFLMKKFLFGRVNNIIKERQELINKQFEEAEEINEKIKNYSFLLKKAIQVFKPDEIIRLRRMLKLYYDERSEMRYVGRLLSNYYEKEKIN